MNHLSKTSSMDFQDPERIHRAWKSRIHTFIQDPLPWRRVMREANEARLLDESLETLLSKKSGQTAFRDFLKSEFCEENLDFWLACQEFKTLDGPEEQREKAAIIYEQFVKADSIKQVNLDFYTREIISHSLQHASPLCFAVAEKQIYSLMENGSFPRFIQSEQYRVQFDSACKHRGLGKHTKALRKRSSGGIRQQDLKAVIL